MEITKGRKCEFLIRSSLTYNQEQILRWPLIGPSMTHDALRSWQRSPAKNVWVFQWPKGRAHAQPLAFARALAQSRHFGLIEKHQAVRLLTHARLALGAPDPALIPHVGARTPPP